MKKLSKFLLIFVLILSLTAFVSCGGDDDDDDTPIYPEVEGGDDKVFGPVIEIS